MKGILLAGGRGTRLDPLTRTTSKQLLPIFDKPIIHYPLATLMLAGVREILVVTTPVHASQFRSLLGTGSQWGIRLEYLTQPEPQGIAQALSLGRSFLGTDSCFLMLGDNVVIGPNTGRSLGSWPSTDHAQVFGIEVADPRPYAVVELGSSGEPVSIEEKPARPMGHLAVPGMYLYPPGVADIADDLAVSDRGEYEITDVNRWYLERRRLSVTRMPRGTAWLDTGTPELMNAAGNLVRILQERFGQRIADLDEISFRMGLTSRSMLFDSAQSAAQADRRDYLLRILEEADEDDLEPLPDETR